MSNRKRIALLLLLFLALGPLVGSVPCLLLYLYDGSGGMSVGSVYSILIIAYIVGAIPALVAGIVTAYRCSISHFKEISIVSLYLATFSSITIVALTHEPNGIFHFRFNDAWLLFLLLFAACFCGQLACVRVARKLHLLPKHSLHASV